MSNPTVAIPQDRLPELEAAIAKLNKKAKKLGTSPISLEVGEPFEKQVSEAQWADFVPVTVTGETPKLNGWVLVATLEHDENGTLIRRLPDFLEHNFDLRQYAKVTPANCDHCHTNRRRNDTYIVARVAFPATQVRSPGYETKQVGSSCLKDFTGHENPEAIAKHLQAIRDFIESVQGGSYAGGHIVPRHDLVTVVAVAAREVAENGYISRKEAWDSNGEKISTSEATRTRWHNYLRSEFERDNVTQKHFDQARQAIDWVRSLSEDDLKNEYLWNLYTTCKGESIAESQFGFAASALVAYQKSRPAGDGDRHKGHVTRTDDEPTEPQKEYIKKLAAQLDSPYDIPETRLEASDLINTMKAALAMSREVEPEASEKQLWLINKLMDKKQMPADKRQEARSRIDAGLTKARASQCIEWLQTFEDAS